VAIRWAGLIADMIDCEDCREQGHDRRSAALASCGACYQRGVKRERPVQCDPSHDLYRQVWHCPRSCAVAVSAHFDDWFWLGKGHLPQAGGYEQQQHYYCEAMDLIGIHTAKAEAEALREIREQAKGKGR